MFRTITAKFAGTCKRCGEVITVGEKIRYGGRGRTYHFASVCAGGSTASDVNYGPGGRCEDAPCCGHGGRCGVPMGYPSSYAGVEF